MSVRLSDLKLNIENVVGKKTGIICNSIDDRYVRNKDGRESDILDGWNINVPAGGSMQAVKLPLQARKVVEEAKSAISKGDLVLVKFLDFTGTPYVIIGDGESARLRTGVSCTASSMQIKVIPVETEDDDDEELAL